MREQQQPDHGSPNQQGRRAREERGELSFTAIVIRVEVAIADRTYLSGIGSSLLTRFGMMFLIISFKNIRHEIPSRNPATCPLRKVDSVDHVLLPRIARQSLGDKGSFIVFSGISSMC